MSDNLASLVRERCRSIVASNTENACNTPERCFAILSGVAGLKDSREHVVALYLDARRCLRGKPYVVSIGTVSSSLVHPREVFAEACRRNASGFVLAHNHPSGDPTPSADDLALTRRLRQCGDLMGIEMVDHIVMGDACFVSLKQRGEL